MTADPITWRTRYGDVVEVYPQVQDNGPGPAWTGCQLFRYRIRARNGQVVETGSEAYTRRRNAVRAAERHHPRVEDQ